MVKSTQTKPAPKKRGKYEEKLAVKGSFMDIIGAAVNDANKGKKESD
jgi:hypothetical protein